MLRAPAKNELPQLPYHYVYSICPKKMYRTGWYESMRTAATTLCPYALSNITPVDLYQSPQAYEEISSYIFQRSEAVLLFPAPDEFIGAGCDDEALRAITEGKHLYVVFLRPDYWHGIHCVHIGDNHIRFERDRSRSRFVDTTKVVHDDAHALWLAQEPKVAKPVVAKPVVIQRERVHA